MDIQIWDKKESIRKKIKKNKENKVTQIFMVDV